MAKKIVRIGYDSVLIAEEAIRLLRVHRGDFHKDLKDKCTICFSLRRAMLRSDQ